MKLVKVLCGDGFRIYEIGVQEIALSISRCLGFINVNHQLYIHLLSERSVEIVHILVAN